MLIDCDDDENADGVYDVNCIIYYGDDVNDQLFI